MIFQTTFIHVSSLPLFLDPSLPPSLPPFLPLSFPPSLLSQAMSRSCTKVFFWSTPYACRSEHSSCTHIVDNKLYDFTPLQSNPGEKARKIHHRYIVYTHVCRSLGLLCTHLFPCITINDHYVYIYIYICIHVRTMYMYIHILCIWSL